MGESRNVVMVLADQHHAGLLGCAGHAQVRTPHLDALAREGTRFTAAYAQNPICTPSRVSILSGQYCHNHRLYGLGGPVPCGLGNLFGHFRRNGYRTAGLGKMHLPLSPRNWVAEDLDYFGDTYETPDGVEGTSEFLRGLETAGWREWEDSWHNPWNYGTRSIPWDAMPSRLPLELTQEMWCVDRASRFIAEQPDRPFFVQIAFQRPHHPLLPNPRFWEDYPPDLDLPATYHHCPAGRPPHFRAAFEQMRHLPWDFAQPGEAPEAGARRAWRGTLASITQIDHAFGRLVAFLREKDLWDNTIIIYGSDHGAYHGIHGLAEKAPGICADAVCRVPMIWRVPGTGSTGTECATPVENIDMAPTLTALCELPAMESNDGSSLAGILHGGASGPRDGALTENPWSKAFRWDRWRFVHYPRAMFDGADVGELYDLEADPDEQVNLYHDPAHHGTVEESRRRLLERLVASTRITTMIPGTMNEPGPTWRGGRFTFPCASDGSAPDRLQPRNRSDLNRDYL